MTVSSSFSEARLLKDFLALPRSCVPTFCQVDEISDRYALKLTRQLSIYLTFAILRNELSHGEIPYLFAKAATFSGNRDDVCVAAALADPAADGVAQLAGVEVGFRREAYPTLSALA